MFACLYLPDFSVQATLRCEPEQRRELLIKSGIVILEGSASNNRVISRNDAARQLGIELGMKQNGIEDKAQDAIVKFITSFALYGFPESHAASFALIAYASAFLKVRYLAAFTAALLNNWPMGFYHPATIVKDAQRHGLSFRPVDVMHSDWNCKLEQDVQGIVVRLGFRYVRGMARNAS